MQNSAMGPPENAVRTKVGFPVSRVSATAECLPKSSCHFLTADISPAKLNVALIADFVQNYRFMIFLAPLVYQLGGAVCLSSLDAAMGDPGQVIIIIRFAVMNGSEMMIWILLTDNAGISVRRILTIISDPFITVRHITIITCLGLPTAASREQRHTVPPSW